MAEVLGVIASGVGIGALAGQIALSVARLKTYLDQIRDAPEDLKILIDEIESLHLLLSDIEDEQSRNPSSSILVENNSSLRCLDHCKRGVERLQRVVDEMAVDFDGLKPMKRKLVSAKIIWKRDRIEKYKAELASAIRLLTLSCQIHTRSLVQLQPDIITSRIARLMQIEFANIAFPNSVPSLSTSQVQGFTSSMRTNRAGESRSRRIQSTWLRWKLSSLILGRAWDLEICRSQQGWKFSISTYAIVPFDSLVVEYCGHGDIEGLQRLFSQGEASPFTICLDTHGGTTYERTLLEIGAEIGNFKLCEFLINQSANLVFSHVSSLQAIDRFAQRGVWDDHYNSDSCNLAALLGSRSEYTFQTLLYYRGPVSVFSVLLNHMDTPISELAIECRCNLAIQLAERPECSPDLFLMALGCDSIPGTAITHRLGDGRTLLHSAAEAIGRLATSGYIEFCTEEFERRILGWKYITKELVAGGADLHAAFPSCGLWIGFDFKYAKCYSRVTPLTAMFAGCFSEWVMWLDVRMGAGKAMALYITTLYKLGVNLKEYGLKESLTWEPLEVQISYIGGQEDKNSDYYFPRRRVLGFSYGPYPEDWRVWESEATDEFVGDFWLMLDKREEIMPGSWIE
ncbi:hypothetical protein N431DRAFT_479482 [Stipitochalara longipes BDJ]|nr:hypothetical protein N431DRAFT_479482 [Stipitochalara longipes BDJ]